MTRSINTPLKNLIRKRPKDPETPTARIRQTTAPLRPRSTLGRGARRPATGDTPWPEPGGPLELSGALFERLINLFRALGRPFRFDGRLKERRAGLLTSLKNSSMKPSRPSTLTATSSGPTSSSSLCACEHNRKIILVMWDVLKSVYW